MVSHLFDPLTGLFIDLWIVVQRATDRRLGQPSNSERSFRFMWDFPPKRFEWAALVIAASCRMTTIGRELMKNVLYTSAGVDDRDDRI